MLKIWYWDTWLRPSCRIWVCTEKLGIPKLLGVNSNSATRPELSIPIKLGSRLDGTSGMVPRWVATCQLHQLHFVYFGLSLGCCYGAMCWDMKETQIKQYNCCEALWRFLKYCRTSSYFCIWSSIATLVPWTVSTWHLTTGTLYSNPILKPSMAFQRKASMFKSVLPKCPVLPHC